MREAKMKYVPMSCAPAPKKLTKISRAMDVWIATKPWWNEMREHFILFGLDVRHRIVVQDVIAIGTLSGVEVHPREVVRPLIVNHAAAVIIAHNHPSGDVTPSKEDIELTARLRECTTLFGITMHDHVIFHADGFLSMTEKGFL